MLKKEKWFKEFQEVLRRHGCDDFTIEAFSAGARINKEFQMVTPKEAINEHIDKRRQEVDIIEKAKALCQKFINKVLTGRARSRETYAECKALLKMINEREEKNVNKSGS